MKKLLTLLSPPRDILCSYPLADVNNLGYTGFLRCSGEMSLGPGTETLQGQRLKQL